MIAVGISTLATSPEVEAPHLARETGLAIYDARVRLSQPPPIIVLRTPDETAGRALLANLRSRGHGASMRDEETVLEPTLVRAFRFDAASLDVDGVAIAYADMLALVRAAQSLRSETTKKTTERKLSPGAAILTGGLILSKKVTREEKRVARDREDILYVFTAGASWLVTEFGTSYASLDAVAPTRRENFLRVVTDLRTRAPRALYDERLLARRDDADLTLRAHLLIGR